MGAPIGNKNGCGPRDRVFTDAVKRAVLANDGEKLRKLADTLVDCGIAGDVSAIKEIGDRIEGKVTQTTVISGPDGGPIEQTVRTIRFVDAGGNGSTPEAAAALLTGPVQGAVRGEGGG